MNNRLRSPPRQKTNLWNRITTKSASGKRTGTEAQMKFLASVKVYEIQWTKSMCGSRVESPALALHLDQLAPSLQPWCRR